MINIRSLWQSMTKWNVFLTSCVFVAGLSLKVGAPLPALMLGFGLAGAMNWTVRRRQRLEGADTTAGGVRNSNR